MRITRTISTFAIAGVAALGLVACGGDDDADSSAAPESSTPAETEPAAEPEEPATEPTTEDSPAAEPSPAETPSGDAGANAAYCDAIEAAGADLAGLENISDPTAIDAETAQRTADALANVAAVAPADVQDGWTAMGDLFAAIAEADGDLSRLDPSALDQTAISAASQDIPQSVQEDCGTGLGGVR